MRELRKIKEEESRLYVSTGSTLLNLALSDNPYGGFALGKFANIIGDYSAGKSFLAWTIFSEAVYNSKFDEYTLRYIEPEVAFEFNIIKLFGKKVEDRVLSDVVDRTVAKKKKDEPYTVEDWYNDEEVILKQKIPFIDILDSLDATTTVAEYAREIDEGSYRVEKARLMPEILRKIAGKVKDTNSLIIVVSQAKEPIGMTFGASTKTRAGGKALHFFCTYEIWMAIKSHIKRKDRDVGVNVRVKISKNKMTGKQREIEFPIYFDYGIDDETSMINFLLEEGVWNKPKNARSINTNGDFIDGTMETIIKHIEENNGKDKLIQIVAKKWREIEDSIATNRKGKYDGEAT